MDEKALARLAMWRGMKAGHQHLLDALAMEEYAHGDDLLDIMKIALSAGYRDITRDVEEFGAPEEELEFWAREDPQSPRFR